MKDLAPMAEYSSSSMMEMKCGLSFISLIIPHHQSDEYDGDDRKHFVDRGPFLH